MPNKQVATKKTNGKLAVMSEDMFASDAGAGLAGMGQEDLAIPFLKILQKTSSEVDEIKGAKVGDIFNSVTKDIVQGKKGLRVVNCVYFLEYLEWEPRGTGDNYPYHIFSSTDKLPPTKRGDDNKDYIVDGDGRYLERTAQHYVLVLDDDGITQQGLMPMKATQFKKSKQWNSAMRALKMRDDKGKLFVPPRFSHIWNLSTAKEENLQGSWYGWVIAKEGKIEDSNLYEEAKTFAELISAGAVRVQHIREDNSRDDDVPF
jgi:hypothetical protein